MKNQDFLIIVVIAVIIIGITYFLSGSDREDYSYHFGFPTWSAINNTYYGVRGYNPFLARWYPKWRYSGWGYPPHRYYDSQYVRPYLTDRCYTSNEVDDCKPGYKKIGRDTDGDGEKDKWKCCRKWR